VLCQLSLGDGFCGRNKTEVCCRPENKHYGIPKAPLSYERYVELIDVETYRKTNDLLLAAIIEFTLDEFHWRKIKIKNPENILQIYHAKMGLDHDVLRLLKQCGLTGPEIASLYRQNQVPLLLRCLTPPESGQDDYIAFLENISSDKLLDAGYRFEAYSLLYQLDKQKYLAGYKAFLIKNVNQVSSWSDRCRMNPALLEIGDQECLQIVKQNLLNAPLFEVRTSILDSLKEQGIVAEFLDTIQLLAEGKGKAFRHGLHFGNGPGMNEGDSEYKQVLRRHLSWARQQDNLTKAAQEKIQSSLYSLRIGKPAPKIRPKNSEDSSAGKGSPQET
tara:strand:+ start:3515 stop:4507 length:993 start_codon:yes stop_codon:yes gene_type:complete